ncbi:hypothetical protein ACFL35_10375 [Candidatus Riflebacteria bacterium]
MGFSTFVYLILFGIFFLQPCWTGDYYIKSGINYYKASSIWIKEKSLEFKNARKDRWYFLPLDNVDYICKAQAQEILFKYRRMKWNYNPYSTMTKQQQRRLAVLESIDDSGLDTNPGISKKSLELMVKNSIYGTQSKITGREEEKSPVKQKVDIEKSTLEKAMHIAKQEEKQKLLSFFGETVNKEEKTPIPTIAQEGVFGILNTIKEKYQESERKAVEEESEKAEKDTTTAKDGLLGYFFGK